MRIKVKGLNKVLKQLNTLPNVIDNGLLNGTNEITENIRDKAKSNVTENSMAPKGDLARSINSNAWKDGTVITGNTYADSPNAIFQEFGTGPRGNGTAPFVPNGFTPRYSPSPWFIHESQTKQDLNEVYGVPLRIINGERFFYSSGHAANPFLYPAYLDVMRNADETFKKNMQDAIRRIT